MRSRNHNHITSGIGEAMITDPRSGEWLARRATRLSD